MTKLQKNYKEIFILIGNIIWAQWNRLGLNGTGGCNRYSTDVEATLLIAAYGSRLDGRLFEGVWSWLKLYASLVNRERLALIISESKDVWIAQFFGALLENTDPKHWKAIIKKCRQLMPAKATPVHLMIQSVDSDYRTLDPVFSKWNILYAQIKPSQKLKTHENILNSNALLKYRFLYGTNIRADVLYLLSVSQQCHNKRAIDVLNTYHLAAILQCYPSTIHRIQKDLETGGFLHVGAESWMIKDLPFIHVQPDVDRGIIDWIKINKWLMASFELNLELEKSKSEVLAKSRIRDFFEQSLAIFLQHGIDYEPLHNLVSKPLETYSFDDLIEELKLLLKRFYQILCTLTIVRCKKCHGEYVSPIQLPLSAFKTSKLEHNILACPICETKIPINKLDLFFYDGMGRESRLPF